MKSNDQKSWLPKLGHTCIEFRLTYADLKEIGAMLGTVDSTRFRKKVN